MSNVSLMIESWAVARFNKFGWLLCQLTYDFSPSRVWSKMMMDWLIIWFKVARNSLDLPIFIILFYTITEILRALWLSDACYLLEDRCTNDVTAWRDSRAWSKFIAVSRAGKDFQNSGPKQSEKYSALVEDFNEKETAEYQSQWEAFNSAKHARSLPGKKKLSKLFESCVVYKFADAGENPRMLMNGNNWTLLVVAYWAG